MADVRELLTKGTTKEKKKEEDTWISILPALYHVLYFNKLTWSDNFGGTEV